jgi:hypothetical protein
MSRLAANFIDALIPLGFAVLLLAYPQVFTKKDLKADENQKLAARFKTIGWLLLAAGVLILIGQMGSTLAK